MELTLINILLLIFVVVGPVISGVTFLGIVFINSIKVTPEEIEIRRVDYPFASTTYYSEPTKGYDMVNRVRLLRTSTMIQSNNQGIYSIRYSRGIFGGRGTYTVIREVSGSIGMERKKGSLTGQSFEKYKTDFEKAERMLQKTRIRFKSFIG